MSRGELAFCGEPEEMVNFFSQCGYECPEYCNPFDIYGTAASVRHASLRCRPADPRSDLPTVDYTSVDTRSSEREATTFSRMQAIARSYQSSEMCQNMLAKAKQSRQRADKPAIPFKNKESPSGAAKLQVLCRYTCCSRSSRKAHFNLNLLAIFTN